LPGGVRDINNPLQDSKFVKKYNSIVPIGRMARPDEIAYLAEFLISDYSTYISGAAIPVDGGWTAI